jgi:uncharacterized repeat protein (TIGR03833 family)
MDEINNQIRNKICKGALVDIVLKQDQKTGKLTRGKVKDILTKSPVHHRGIKVRLENGLIGRIQSIIDNNDNYQYEAEQKYKETEEYSNCAEKYKDYNSDDLNKINKEAESIYNQFVNNMEKEVSDPIIQGLVSDWKNHISNNYYECSNEILLKLGRMYVNDERFKNNIDKYKKGVASYISEAIEYYCKNN